MPCLNEAETVGRCVAKAWMGLKRSGLSGEVLVADNGSTDGSQAAALEAGARVVHVEAPGYGSALHGAITAARGEFVIMGDADETYDFSRIEQFILALERGDDLVLGNRFAGGIEKGAMPTLNRYLGNPVLSALGRLFFRSPVSDFHCGLRAFRRSRIMALELASPGMEYASEMVIKASLAGLRITEVPTTLSSGIAGRRPHLRPWRDGWRHLRLLLLYSPRWLFLYPGLLLGALGLAATLALLPGPLDIGSVRFEVDTLLYSTAAILLGYQLVVFAVFARIFGMTQGFLPEDPQLRRLLRFIRLEVGLAVGAGLLAGGLAGAGYTLAEWSSRSFGQLDYSHVMRIAIPSAGLLVLGTQTIVTSFFLSFIGLRDRRVVDGGERVG
ncbi:MAG: glycosyltransferase family 2 protein [Acidobacteriota bacterium]|nr:glycosyltransferase family 2 protein [Acidobacteriota bacterium]